MNKIVNQILCISKIEQAEPMKAQKGDTVIYRGRKWFYISDINGKANIVLLQGEKKFWRGIQEINQVTTAHKNIKLYEGK